MTNRPDPRLDVLLPLFDWRRGFAVSVLNSLDAVDPKRRLLDTLDALDPDAPGHEALVERLAEVIEMEVSPQDAARDVLAALREET